jgi:filamentous hemagglutinin family protein
MVFKERYMGKRLGAAAAATIVGSFCFPWVNARGSRAEAATLPVPCVGSVCGGAGFVTSGLASAAQAGTKLTVTQTSGNATLNWQSFNISADGAVQFIQPSASSVALNNIYDANPTQILGALNANGRVFLINQNGIIFGAGAQVNVGGLLASTLAINPAAVAGGLTAPGSNGQAAFEAFGNGVASGAVSISSGATLQTAAGGEILIFAPQITNQGSISTPAGQTVLAAGDTIYLASSSDPNLRGLLVEVGGAGGTVTNGSSANSTASSASQLAGQISATDGNVTLAGLAVNQLGRVSATTSINENGSIRLQAGDHGSISASGTTGVSGTPEGGTGGTLTLGQQSDTEVTLDSSDPSTTVDSVAQPKSDIAMSGTTVDMLSGSVARATSGTIEVTTEQSANEAGSAHSDGSRFYLAPGALLDVSGARAVLPVSDNVIAVQLRGSELADSPVQQNGPLRGQTVYVDIRQGTPLADISGEIAAIGHNVVERNLDGGTIAIQSHGDAILAPGSTVDVAGGEIQYTAGYLNTTKLITTTGQIVDIGQANPNVTYAGIANTATVSSAKWGVSNSYAVTQGSWSPGYVEGKDAGTLSISAPQFIFDGNVNASVVTGSYQRAADQAVAAGTLYRSYDELPKAATLIIGSPGGAASDFVVDNVTLTSSEVLPGLTAADGSPFDPLSDALPSSYTSSVLRPALIGADGFGNVDIHTDGEYLQPADVSLALPADGSFGVYANVVDIEGKIDVPGGSITAISEPTAGTTSTADYGLILGPQAALTARGAWVNDSLLLNPSGNSAPLVTNGGAVTLEALSNDQNYSPGIDLAAGSLIDVSGGAQLTSSGSLKAGTGGSIDIAATTLAGTLAGAPPKLVLGATLSGYGLYDGGSLSLADGSVCINTLDCSDGNPSVLWISPAALASGGFSSYALTANQGGLDVADGTGIVLQQKNFVLPSNFGLISNRPTLVGLAGLGTLAAQLRQPVSLSLTQDMAATSYTGFANVLATSADTPSLTIGSGASIVTDPEGSLSLSSNVRLDVEGTLRAPGGDISLTLLADNLEQNYDPTQAIWLGSQAVLDASGTAELYQNKLGERVGSVLDGGTVTLNAQRGFVELLSGSLINVDGTQALVDVSGVGGGLVHPEQVASAGGSVVLTAAEGINLSGTLAAAAGVAGSGVNQPAGGSFSLTLDGSQRGDYALSFGGVSGSPFLNGIREVTVGATQPPLEVAADTAVPDALDGIAYVSAAALQNAGFDSLSLKATSLPTAAAGGGTVLVPGEIDFSGNVTLAAADSITLDAATYRVGAGATAQVQAPYVEFGNSDQLYHDVPVASGGTGTLDVTGGFIQLYGSSSLQNIGAARFDSSGDLRLLGLLDLSSASATTLNGALNADGNVELSAQQIYPTTLTQFVISTDPSSIDSPTAGSLLIQGTQGSNQQLLSAGGSLTLSAGSITQDGVLRAPFGSIVMDAQSVTLGAGSLTSTSADGLTIPFGTTQGGLDWVYALQNGTDIVYGTDGITPPSQHVTLSGAQVDVQKGAVIDVSGGGDLMAYEWVAGTGGTQDVLSQAVRPNQFAIVPSLQANVAPYDPSISNGSTLAVGDSVYLSGVPGLPAGVYTLLPARYALLPGAYVVSAVAGYQDIQPGQSFAVQGGGTIVSGYRTIAGTSFADSRTSGFDVAPASVVLKQAQYTVTSGNQFFSSQAQSAGVAASALPQDAGVLALVASQSLALDGTLNTAAAAGGIGAEVDISSADILVASDGSAASAGQIVLTPDSLDALGAQTLLLGGLRDGTGSVDTSAHSVQIADGVSLSAPVVLLTAQNAVDVDAGASVSATGSAPAGRSYVLSGDGAFLSVSAGDQSSVTRSGASGASGVLTLASGSIVSAPGGAIYLDASGSVAANGTLLVDGGDLAVQSPNIILGAAPATVSGTVLGSGVLSAQGLRHLLLQSSSGIEIYGSVDASAQSIVLDSPGLAGFGTSSDVANLAASGALSLGNPLGLTSLDIGTGSGSLSLSGSTIQLTGGALSMSGFSTVGLNATGQLEGQGASPGLSTSGDLSVTASQITTGADVDLALAGAGDVSLRAPAQPATLTAVSALGGSLSVTGGSIEVATPITLPSGRVTLTATNAGGPGVSLQAGASISVAGVDQSYDGVAVATPGGQVTLASAADVQLAAGSSVDVSAGDGGQAGSLSLSATGGTADMQGTLRGVGADGRGGSLSLDAQQFTVNGASDDLDALVAQLNGFSGALSVRLRGGAAGNADLSLGAGTTVSAHQLSLETDQGAISVDGVIDASGASGGAVTLAASNGLTVNGTIDARATAAGQSGGDVNLEITGASAPLLLGATSSIEVSGGGADAASGAAAGTGGEVLLRVPRSTVAALVSGGSGVTMDGTIQGASQTVLEAFSTYQNTTGMISASDTVADVSNPLYADAVSFMTNADAITAALGQSGNGVFALEPGVEIDASTASNGTGTLTLGTDWNLYDWRFGAAQAPGVLTLRAENGVTFNASLSDGFAATSGAGAYSLPAQTGNSWSYRIIAGADLGAANALAVNAADPANVTLSPGSGLVSSANYHPTMVRTGNGFIDVGASGNFVLGNQESVLYTAGIAASGIVLTGGRGSLQGLAYPTDGGNIQIDVAGDILGSTTNQFVNDWLWRVGSTTSTPMGSATAWTVNFQDFQQGIGALGGGNVSVSAGGDITDLSASIPTIGEQIGGTTEQTSQVQVLGGGNLTVSAGGSIRGGSYYAGAGSLTLLAGNDVGADDASAGGTGLAPIIGLGNASLTVTARGNLSLAEILNPTLLNRGALQGAGGANVYFSTYGTDSSASLTAIGGDVVLNDDNVDVASVISTSFLGGILTDQANSQGPLDLLPQALTVQALSGNIGIGRTLALSPAANGNLQLFANQNVVATVNSNGNAGQLIVSDADPAALPSAASPTRSLQIYDDIIAALSQSLPDQHASSPVHASEEQSGMSPVRIIAQNGSVDFQPNSGGEAEGIWSAKPVQISAGLDVVDLNLVAQNLGAADVTSVTAGRDIIYAQQRLSSGQIATDNNGITVDGPGQLQLAAGRNVNLGTSSGISTRANLLNPVLAPGGASVSVEAGLGGGAPQIASFITQYVDGSDQFDSEVTAFVQSIEGSSGLSAVQAKQQFDAMNSQLQRSFVEQLFFDLLRYYGRKEASSGNGDFSGAFAAIQTLFPGANPSAGQSNPYAGNIDLYFSRIYTQQGGGISLLAPGGNIDVGLALAPASFGINKAPDQLGIVAQTSGDVNAFTYSDFQVNQSRVFAADGGDILVWTTDGNIDAGRGAKTAISAPSLNIAYDTNGQPTVTLRAAIAGSGIQALAASPGVSPGDVDLFAPHGVVNADDAGIVAGNLTVAATAVLGTGNITVSGTSVGVPVVVTGLGAAVAGAASAAGATANQAQAVGGQATGAAASSTPAADAAISWLQVFITGLGEENCKPDDVQCLQRQTQGTQGGTK